MLRHWWRWIIRLSNYNASVRYINCSDRTYLLMVIHHSHFRQYERVTSVSYVVVHGRLIFRARWPESIKITTSMGNKLVMLNFSFNKPSVFGFWVEPLTLGSCIRWTHHNHKRLIWQFLRAINHEIVRWNSSSVNTICGNRVVKPPPIPYARLIHDRPLSWLI